MDASQRLAPLVMLAAVSCSRNAAFPEHGSTQTEALATAQASEDEPSALPRGASHHGGVSTYSSLPALFGGELGSQLRLSELPAETRWVGVGSLSELRGEIAIFDGEIWVSYPAELEARRNSQEQATFLAVARVNDWDEVTLKRDVSWQRLPDELARHARGLGFSENVPVAIRIDDRVEDIEFNIVNGPALGIEPDVPRPLSQDELSRTASKRSFAEARAMITGFYARGNGGAFIHAGKEMHLHIILPEVEQMGHLDGATLPEGLVLQLGRPVTDGARYHDAN